MKIDLLIHPVRLRIIQALVPDRCLTIGEIGASLDDIPQASLYRHVNTLVRGDVLAAVAERQIRGATERVYRIAERGADIGPGDLATATPADHLRYFTTFVATVLTDYGRYLERANIDLVRDGVGYRQASLELSDDEFASFTGALNAAVAPFLGRPPRADRTRRTLSTIVMPTHRPAKKDAVDGC